jgi:hypothetical protein
LPSHVADSQTLSEAFRLIHHDECIAQPGKNSGDKVVISVGIEQGLGDQLWWCVWREDADSLETFFSLIQMIIQRVTSKFTMALK